MQHNAYHETFKRDEVGEPNWNAQRMRIARERQPEPKYLPLCHDLKLPKGWVQIKKGLDGAAYMQRSLGLAVISSVMREQDEKHWLHVSVSRRNRIPTYDDLTWAKELFIGRDLKAVQVFAPTHEHVNLNPHVLHLWCCLEGDPLPDFTHQSGSI